MNTYMNNFFLQYFKGCFCNFLFWIALKSGQFFFIHHSTNEALVLSLIKGAWMLLSYLGSMDCSNFTAGARDGGKSHWLEAMINIFQLIFDFQLFSMKY